MQAHPTKEPRRRKFRESLPQGEVSTPIQEPVHSQPVSPCDDLQARIAKRAYEIHAERGYRYGYALDDWLAAEREVLDGRCTT